MSDNSNFSNAKNAKNDEFYTRYIDIQNELTNYITYNKDVFRGKTILLPCDDPAWSEFTRYFVYYFEQLGLKKLISTSYVNDKKRVVYKSQLSWFEENFPQYDETKTNSHGKIFTLDEEDLKKGKKVNIDDLKWDYLEGDGDFRSAEVTALRDEADFIITNPPFSLFREFVSWIMEANKKFIIIGNQNAITYKKVFPLIKDNKIWLGCHSNINLKLKVPDYYDSEEYEEGEKVVVVPGVTWFTNVEHGKRHEILKLDTMANNLRYNNILRKKLMKKFGKIEYPHYDNYDAIEIPFVKCIPKDYNGVMGVPITFLDDFNPEQFEIVGMAAGNSKQNHFNYDVHYTAHPKDAGGCGVINGEKQYARILIQDKHSEEV